jgi:ubiquinone biosynthesis monooxygenase Coq7
MELRSFSLLDRLVGEIDKAIKVLGVPASTAHGSVTAAQAPLEEADRRKSGRLMRVNHAGEVAAQALYNGQALTARSAEVAAALHRSAAEEADHLAWCESRLAALNTRTSVLNPLWYGGSFALGALAGALGDRTSLGFVAETEKQVESHLTRHLERLPPADLESRAILERMKQDESEHGARAERMGGRPLPFPIPLAMRLTSRLMTHGSYWL